MLNSISSDSFQIDKMGNDMISIKVNGFGNSICFSAKKIDEMIVVLQKAEEEFFPQISAKKYLDKLFK